MSSGAPLETGHLLDGRYRVGKVIGVGGMGRVYLANDTRLANRPVAVKEMLVGEGLQEKKAVEDFAREARVLAPLSHSGIPNLIDYFAENQRHYLVMEYIAGGDLQGWLDQRGAGARVPEVQVLRWGRQILDVLSFLHAQQPPIVYRDLKPGNIMIDKSGRAMLIDFGIARFLPPGGRGTQIGSLGYAPPEQYLGKLEPRSDIYSLGATLHHLLTGRDPQLAPPFSFPPVRQLAADVSVETEKVVMQALERDAAKRPESALRMLELLPNPGPEPTGVPLNGSLNFEPTFSAIATAVLTPAAKPLSPAVRPEAKTPRSLSRPAPPASPPRPVPEQRPATAAPASALANATVSSTAKTTDLKKRLKVAAPASVPAISPAIKPPAPVVAPARRNPGLSAPSPPAARPGSEVGRNGAVANRGVAHGEVSAWTLICRNENLQYPIRGPRMTVGRHAGPADQIDIDLGVLQHGGERISRRHAEIIQRGDEFFVRDLGSLNGTFIVGQGRLGRDQLYRLKDRDQVIFGAATFEFRKG